MSDDRPELTFAALQAAAHRIGPRYRVEDSGACGSCGLGATGADVVQGVVYFVCAFCATRWRPSTPRRYDGMFVANYDEHLDVLEQQLSAMASYDELEPTHPAPNPQPMMTPATTGVEGATMTPEKPRSEIENLAVRLALQHDERLAAARALEHPASRPLSAEELAVWSTTRSREDSVVRERRAKEAAWYRGYADYTFTVNCEELLGGECASRLEAGAPLADFLRAESSATQRIRR